ncbi:MAG: PhoH family protein [Gammaproteobacteria bacterium]|nr:PhoH family protein [Gammaproteobacteria bacterium]MBQ0839222.1 PhoH family protein [Gammaproteobacteria bacterium]
MTRRTSAKRKQKRKANDTEHQYSEPSTSRKRRKQPDDTVVEINAQNQGLHQAHSTRRSNLPLHAKTPAQERYIKAIRQHCLTLGLGPAGTGKSYCAGALAAEALESGKIERIILTRPAVEAGEQLGFLPGSLDEKFAVYIDAFRDILNERLGAGTVNYCIRHGRIVAAPLAFMRGKTFSENTFVILDEAQNTSTAQMKMFLTRIGEDCKVVINGDIRQSDIRGSNGLSDAVDKLTGLSGVYVHHFEYEDIVRSGLVKSIIDRYEPQEMRV